MYRLKALQTVAQRAMAVTSCVDHVAAATCTQNALRFGATVTERNFRTAICTQMQAAADAKEASKLVDRQFQRGSQTLQREATMRRMLYRSQQRGFLELDLIVGRWVAENVQALNDDDLHNLVMVLDEENPDLYRWLTEQEAPPSHMASNPVYIKLQERTTEFLKANAPTAARAAKGAQWTKPWHDSGDELPPPKGAKWFDTQN
mmetsp:Transcript_22135/g.48584  ORF Transcript_22135/g.48584 Transcript_22135/m.48584 type:complete len:204 (-) Transcript_22135:202-813(-)|eukprot:CAMPEP_0118926132 /NCGR_PEP_ID=MMETSP1169-20130426/3908_1 /TAXON_ID=36882 /ORGANISM="Pyramimonas obovata, Strain CCMP722" /LENGTH=203 /DNA_ID=CAMNT_0006867629 /DNA_START=106 /DNA_END=717 /DNA_ORIENTATION=-